MSCYKKINFLLSIFPLCCPLAVSEVEEILDPQGIAPQQNLGNTPPRDSPTALPPKSESPDKSPDKKEAPKGPEGKSSSKDPAVTPPVALRFSTKKLHERIGKEKGDFLRQGFAPMLERAVGSVVTVMVTADRPLGPNLDTFSDLNLQEMLTSGLYPKPMSQKVMCSGTGFLVKTLNGKNKEMIVVVTNHHVVEPVVKGNGVIHVAFESGESIPAKIMGVDARTDLAVLAISPTKPVRALPWGKSKDLRVGHWALAIGAPGAGGGGHSPSMQLDFSVTHGIISNINRVVPELAATHITYFLQTDAALNPGNSGGPLLNVEGEVVGINTMIFSASGGSHGMNMAIPSDLALPVITQLAKGKAMQRGYIGIQIGDNVSANWAKHLGMSGPRGVIIDAVLPNTPAQHGGLEAGDVILKINGVPVSHHQQARALIGVMQPGKELRIKIWRAPKYRPVPENGKEMDFHVTVGLLPMDMASKIHGQQVLKVKEFGISFRHIGAYAMARMRMHLNAESAIIVDTVSNPASAEDTLLPGDVILRINETPVSSLEDVRRVMDESLQSGDRTMKFFVHRFVHGYGYREMSKLLAR